MSVITVKNLSFKYPQNNKAALFDVSFGIEKGSYVAIVGHNGCGKSTLARLICGLERPDSGKIEIEANNRIGIVFQSPKDQLVSSIVSRDTAFGPQNLELSGAEVELRVIESLNVVDMLDRAESSTSALSLGQTQKIALSGVIALRPEILILDEAVSMLDPLSRADILDFIRYWHKCGNTIIQITHDLEVIEDADCVIGMEEGKVFYYGTKRAFVENPDYVRKICGEPLPVCDRKGQVCQTSDISLSLRDVTYTYGAGAEKSGGHGIFDINLDFYKGSLTALTGPSGAGKSTLLEACAGLAAPRTGHIYCNSRPALAQQNAKAALFEQFAADDVAFGARNRGMSGKPLVDAVRAAMDTAALPFDVFGERRTFELSGGEQRRLSIAGILVLDAGLIMFDEPTAGLDSKSRQEVMNLLRNLATQGKTVIFSTHKRDEADFADREIKITNGRIKEDSLSLPGVPEISINSEMTPVTSASLIEGLKTASAGLSRAKNASKRTINPFITKLPPVCKILLFLLLFVITLAARPLWFCALMLVVSALYCLFCGFSLRKVFIASLKILPFLLFFSIFQMIFHPALADEVRFTSWKWFMVTPSKLFFCLATIIRTDAALACISGFFVSTPEYDLMDGLKKILRVILLRGKLVRYIILIIEVIFRFIPLLVEEAAAILKTQSIRGGLANARGKLAKIRSVVPLIVPLVIQTIKRSEALADAITMRCFK